MNKLSKIIHHIDECKSTLLGVGPMSKQCVDVAIEQANIFEKPILLIASRRQIDSEEFNGGYVNNWTTAEFAKYVRSNDKKGNILLARDHGGPWQNDKEVARSLSIDDAMESCKRSFKEDIKVGFDFIHIDTSIDIFNKNVSTSEVVERLLDIYSFCAKTAIDYDREIIYEIGTEEQSGSTEQISEKRDILKTVQKTLKRKGIPLPQFVVMQTGTRVHSDRNVGSLDSNCRKAYEIPPEITLPQITSMCNSLNIYLKEHNLDYVSDELLKWHPSLGIHAANVAPEFGTTQTKIIINSLLEYNLTDIYEKMVELAVHSNKWRKWYDPITDSTNKRKAILSMHYIYSSAEFVGLYSEAREMLKHFDYDLESEINHALTKSVKRYLHHFKY